MAVFTGSLQRITCLALLRGQYQTLWYHSTVDPYRSKTYPAWDRPLSHLSGKRKLIETMGQEDVYRFDTDSSPKLLDIGVLRDTLSPGFLHPLGGTMSRKLTVVLFAMLVLTGAMGLKAVVTAHGNSPAVLTANGAPVPTPW